MYKRVCLKLLFSSLIWILSIATVQAQELVLAQLSDRPKKDLKQLRPMVNYVAAQLASVGITSGKVKLYSDLEQLISAFKSGEVHWITETPFTAATLVHEAGAIPLVLKWKSGQQRYQTIIYTRKDSSLKQASDLLGQRLAFEHKHSFSSYFLPRLLLEKTNYELFSLPHTQAEKRAGVINYLFSRNEKNNLHWVHKGIVEAGALNNGDWDNPKRVPPDLKADLRIIYRSDYYPRALELVSPKLKPEVLSALKTLLLSMNEHTHPELLARYEKTTGFEKLPPELPKLLDEIYSYQKSFSQ